MGCLLLGGGVRADELPPTHAPPYSGVYRLSNRIRDNEAGAWRPSSEETISIAIRGKRSRWDFKSDGRVAISDLAGPFTTTFGGRGSANVAYRMRMSLSQTDWEFGYGTAAVACGGKPESLGSTSIAGHACTRLRCASEKYGAPEYCVTKSGIVLRYANQSGRTGWVYEAQSIKKGQADADRFLPPAGYKIEDGEPRHADP
jgi:hypothetical protein